jgi:hypothetical protein
VRVQIPPSAPILLVFGIYFAPKTQPVSPFLLIFSGVFLLQFCLNFFQYVVKVLLIKP